MYLLNISGSALRYCFNLDFIDEGRNQCGLLCPHRMATVKEATCPRVQKAVLQYSRKQHFLTVWGPQGAGELTEGVE